MARFRIAFICNGYDHGWSENWYVERPSESVDALAIALHPLCVKRSMLLGRGCSLKAIRIMLVVDNGGLPVKRVGRAFRKFLPGSLTEDVAPLDISLQTTAVTSDQRLSKITFMGGAWRGIFPNDDTVNTAYGTWTSVFNGFWSEAQIQALGWLHQNILVKRAITDYTFDPLTGLTTYDVAAPGMGFAELNKPQRVSVEFPGGRNPLDGIQIVVPTLQTVMKTAKPRPAPPWTIEGEMRTYGYTFVNLGTQNDQGVKGSLLPVGPVRHQRGRPLLVSRGRAPVKVRW